MKSGNSGRNPRSLRSASDITLEIVVQIAMIAVLIICVYPFFLALVLSFNNGADTSAGGIYFWPRMFTLDNYEKLLTDSAWIKAIAVSVARTVVGTVVTVFFTAFVSFGLSDEKLIGRKFYMGMILFAMYFKCSVIPYYAVLRSLHLMNTFLVYIIPAMLNMFYVVVGINFFQGISPSLREAARIDGAGEMSIFFRVVLPISKPYLATVAIFTAVSHWNDWYASAFFVQKDSLRTLAYKMYAVIVQTTVPPGADMAAGAQMDLAQTTTSMSVRLAAMVIAVAPIIMVYPFFQRYFVSGVTLGAVKE